MSIHKVYAYLTVSDCAAAIQFYSQVFDAKELFRLSEPSGRIGHAELDFGGSTIMLADEFPEYGLRGADSIGATPVTLHLHADNADAIIQRAIEASAVLEREPQDHFYGERSGSFFDPFGHRWLIGHAIEDVSPEEMQRRYTKMMQ